MHSIWQPAMSLHRLTACSPGCQTNLALEVKTLESLSLAIRSGQRLVDDIPAMACLGHMALQLEIP